LRPPEIASSLPRNGEFVEHRLVRAIKSDSDTVGQLIRWRLDKLNNQKDEGSLLRQKVI